MDRIFKLAFTLLLLTYLAFKINADDETGQCHYYNDPHLIPFPSSPDDIPNQNQKQYICRNNCTEILIRNEFLEIFVTPDPQGDYPIVEYTLIFFATKAFPNPCVITDSIANPTTSSLACQPGSPADTILDPNLPPQYQHYFHLSENIQVDIVKRKNHNFNILITQSFDLIQQSTGVCVKWDCELEVLGGRRKKRQTSSSSTISDIINIFVNAAQEKALGKIEKYLVQSLRVGVSYDINKTLDPGYLEAIARIILRDSVKQDQGSDNYKANLLKADALAEEVICEAGKQVNALIAQSDPVCIKDEKGRRCLAPTVNTEQYCEMRGK